MRACADGCDANDAAALDQNRFLGEIDGRTNVAWHEQNRRAKRWRIRRRIEGQMLFARCARGEMGKTERLGDRSAGFGCDSLGPGIDSDQCRPGMCDHPGEHEGRGNEVQLLARLRA